MPIIGAAAAGGAEERVSSVAAMTPWIAETVLALGITPKALPEVGRGLVWRDSPLPPGIADLGLVGEPNMELLDQLGLDRILLDYRLQGHWIERLRRIAPVDAAAMYTPDRRPYELARRETSRLGGLLGRGRAVEELLAQTERSVGDARARLADWGGRSIFVVRLLDDRNLVLYCGGSLFHDVLVALGIEPASAISNDWGFLTTGLETLASVPDAQIVYMEPVPRQARRLFTQSSLWSHLPSVQKGLTTAIPGLYSWGALPTAKRFAEALAEHLPHERAG